MFFGTVAYAMYAILQTAIDYDVSFSHLRMATDETLHVVGHLKRSNLSMLWQLPQIAMMALAETIVTITGNELAYNYASKNLTTVATAFWFFSGVGGNLVTAAVVGSCSSFMNTASIGWVFVGIYLQGAIAFFAMGRFSRVDEEDHKVDDGEH